MINWKAAAKYYRTNWQYCTDLADAHYGRYRKWQDRARRAEARVLELEDILATAGVDAKFQEMIRRHKDSE